MNYLFTQYLEVVAASLATVYKGEEIAKALIESRDFVHLITSEQLKDIVDIQIVEGDAPQNIEGDPVDTSFQVYLEKIIKTQINSQATANNTTLNDYDERKIRFARAYILANPSKKNTSFYLEAGPTTYQRYCLDLHRTKLESLQIMFEGIKKYKDPYAYFGKTMGICVVPITAQGSVYIGERKPNIDNPGLLNFVAGLATFKEKVNNINFYEDVEQELKEEVGISLKAMPNNTKFIGVSSNPFTSETDLVFTVQTNVNETHFRAKKWSEHSRFVRIKDKYEAEKLLDQGILPKEKDSKNIVYSSRLGLEYLVNHHF